MVKDILSSPVITVNSETNTKDTALLMTKKKIGSIVVVEQDQPVGIVTERDFLERVIAPCKDPSKTKIRDIMSAPLITITKETLILDAIRKMRKHDIRRLVVMDGDILIGIVSDRDILRAVSISSLTSFSTLLRKRTSI